MSGLAEKPLTLNPAGGGQVGYEGAFLTKINGRYHLICANLNTVNTDDQPQTHYDCMSASADSIYGSYGNTYLAIPNGGHNTLFKDAQGSHGATGSALRRKNRDWTPGSGVTTKWVIALGH